MGSITKLLPKKLKQKIKRKFTVYSATKSYEIRVNKSPSLAGKNAVVTGGSGAIGRAICCRLAAEGATVYVSGRTESSVKKVVNEICELGLNAKPLIMDVSDSNSIEYAFDSTFNDDNRLDILVNCSRRWSKR